MFKKFKPVLLSFFALAFAFWLGTGIAYEINPRWFLSDTATEVPENPNAFVAKLARLFRNADRAVVIVKESMRTEESLAGTVDDGPLQSEKDYLALAIWLNGAGTWGRGLAGLLYRRGRFGCGFAFATLAGSVC